MNSDKNEAQQLPDGWILCTSKSNPGRKYYFNKKTGKSSWTQPEADDEQTSKRELCKQKGKKDKKNDQEKKKEEIAKINMKRKSSGSESSPLKKRLKPVLDNTSEQCKHDIVKNLSPLKPKVDSPKKNLVEQVNKVETPLKPAQPVLNKNIANSRLSLLREQLNNEVHEIKQMETDKSPQKYKLKISPKTQTETQSKLPRLDLKSPNFSDTKCSRAQSPSSDSIQSMPSPSQFFAANKIISSMKAQLPEEYSNKIKPIDTFARIEEGICNQVTEYPFMKHPATPPQFSEASKLLSAIKSKLTSKVSCKDFNLRTFTSAKERMENLRSRLSNEADNIRSRQSNDADIIRTRISNEAEIFRSRINNEAEGLRSRISNEAENLRSRISNEAGDIRSRISNQGDSIRSRICNQGDSIRNRICNQPDNIRRISNEDYNIRNKRSNDTSDMMTRINSDAENLSGRLSIEADNKRSRISNEVESIKNRFSNVVDNMNRISNQTDSMSRISNQTNNMSRISNQTEIKMRKLSNDTENLTSRFSNDTENLKTRFSDDAENLKTRFSEETENMKTGFSEQADNEVCIEITDEEYLSRIELPPTEAMEVEECKEIKQNGPSFPFNSIQCTKDNAANTENVVLVVDTNIFIHQLDVIKNVLNSHIKGYSEQPNLIVPWRVINELDRLKDNNNGNGAICKRARSAMDYLYKSLPENDRIKGQSLRDANSHIYPCESPDDEILNCCLQQAERGKSVILLSNDKNLCNKAAINGVKCIGLDELTPLLESKPQPAANPDLYASVKYYENAMYQLLANILENEMRAKYNNLWQHVLFKAPPWTFTDVLKCLLKHWIAVFNEVFPRIEHLITDLKSSTVAIEHKDPKSLSQSEVANFKEICLEIAKKCQIIPEYMELAKATVERLQRKSASETKDSERGREMAVIDSFEAMWTVFSSYCAKLSTAVGVQHSLEDKLPSNDSLADLTSKWPLFNSQLRELTSAMNGLLSTGPSDPSIEEHVTLLEIVFKESLAIISFDTNVINRDNMRIFCTNCRNMLQEAFSKFSELVELLDVCRINITNQ